ncbi:MAG TPA: diguanylate cyclase [Bacteroidales bacterium]|nr:diguanylate cyclase [Bacteroidales bacterium]HRW33584.1 diguanylate cyclase [Thermotogota bacterium]
MKEQKTTLKITYNGLRLIWIVLYLIYMIFYGFSNYQSLINLLKDRTTYLVNLFDTLYNQSAIQMVSNPENFQRVLVSDTEGDVLLQYGELIPSIMNISGHSIFTKIQTERIVLSDFYYDPIINDICFDMGIIEKNRIYLGTLSAQRFFKNNLENLDLAHFLIFDENNNGYLYKNNDISLVNYFEKDHFHWIRSSLFISESSLFMSYSENLNNYRLVVYLPFIKEIIPPFLFSILPFIFGLIVIFLAEYKQQTENKIRKEAMEKSLSVIIDEGQVPEKLIESSSHFQRLLFRKLNEKFLNYDNDKKEMKRYVEKLSLYREQLLELKDDMDYLDKYFYNLMNQEEIDFSDSLQALFRMSFEKNEGFCVMKLIINENLVFSKEREDYVKGSTADEDPLHQQQILELGQFKIEYLVNLCGTLLTEVSDIRKTIFEVLSRYISLIYAMKKGLSPQELSITKNFSTFSEMVNRELDKIRRYDDSGILVYLELLNYSQIKDKYGLSVAKIILKRMSEIISATIRNSDIMGIYKEGTFLLYFCNLKEKDARSKIEKMCDDIYYDKKIKQIGINIELKTNIGIANHHSKSFDGLLLKCLQKEHQ